MWEVAYAFIKKLVEVKLILGQETEGVDWDHKVFVQVGQIFKGIGHHVKIERVALKSLICLKIFESAYSHLSR